MRAYGVSLSYLLPTYFPHKRGSGVANADLVELVKRKEEFRCLASLNAEVGADVRLQMGEIKRLLLDRIAFGIKLYPGYQNIDVGSEEVGRVFQIASSLQVPLFVHCGEINSEGHLIDYDWEPLVSPRRLVANLKQYPKVCVVACHLALPDGCWDLLQMMQEYNQLYADMSGVVESAGQNKAQDLAKAADVVRRFVKEAPGRVIFGSDYPIQSYEDSFCLLDRAGVVLRRDALGRCDVSLVVR